MRKPSERGPNSGQIEIRAGSTISGFKGMSRLGDPATIPDTHLWDAENVVIEGGIVKSRSGQTKFTGSALSGPIDGIFDPLSRVTDNPNNNGGVGGGPKIYGGDLTTAYDNERTPSGGSQAIGTGATHYPLWPTSFVGSAAFNGNLYAIYSRDNGASASIDIWEMPPANGSISAPHIVATFAAPDAARIYRVRGITVWRGKLYFTICARSGAGSPGTYAYSWDGDATVTQLTPAVAASVGSDSALGAYGAQLLQAYCLADVAGPSPNLIRSIDPSGTITNLTMPLGSPNFFEVWQPPGTIVDYKGVAYLFGQKYVAPNRQAAIYQVSGATVTEARASGVTDSSYQCGAAFDGYLYYAYSQTPLLAYIGRYDGTSFNDTYVDISAIAGGLSDTWMVVYKGSLYLSNGSAMIKSNGTTVSSMSAVTGGISGGVRNGALVL